MKPAPRLGAIFLTVFVDLLGFGLVLPFLAKEARDTFGVSEFVATLLGSVYSLMQFVATALLGKLSDRIGRRPVLLTTMLFNAAGYTLFAFAGSYWVLFLSRVVSGFAGGNISVAQAYMADITYATNSELAFDYLRDNMAHDLTQTCQRPLKYGIVDEVDSILIDEARTPHIISGQSDEST